MDEYEIAKDVLIESEDYMPALIEWLTDELRALGKINIVTEESGCSLDQDFVDSLCNAFERSDRFESLVCALVGEDDE